MADMLTERRLFQPSLPARGATSRGLRADGPPGISTLAPREGSDSISRGRLSRLPHFNPRSPRGERPLVVSIKDICCAFQPSLPARGATT